MRKNLVKNFVVFGGSTLLCVFFLNFAASLRFDILEKQSYSPNVLAKLPSYMDKAHHFRDKEFYGNSFESLIFSGNLNSKTILLGDSWIERMANHQGKSNSEADLIFKKSIQDVPLNAGIGSFSPSLMQGLVEYIYQNYKVKLKNAIVYIDQTDFGYEIIRYREVLDSNALSNGEVFFDRYKRESDSWHNQVNIYAGISEFAENRNLFGWIDFELKKIILKSKEKSKYPSFSRVVEPLKIMPSDIDKQYFKSRLRSLYSRLVSMGVERIIWISHPHLEHLRGGYVFDVGDLISEFGRESQDLFSRDATQVCLGRLVPSGYDLDHVFYDAQTDPASHLRPTFQSQKFPEAVASLARECFASPENLTELSRSY